MRGGEKNKLNIQHARSFKLNGVICHIINQNMYKHNL